MQLNFTQLGMQGDTATLKLLLEVSYKVNKHTLTYNAPNNPTLDILSLKKISHKIYNNLIFTVTTWN